MSETLHYTKLGEVKEGNQVVFANIEQTGMVERSILMGIVGSRIDSGIGVRITNPVDLIRNLPEPLVMVYGETTPVFDGGRPTRMSGGIGYLQDTVASANARRPL
jgi:hypothetical protein